MRFSVSRLAMFMHCPAQYRFAYIDKLERPINAKTGFGSVVHAALEYLNTTRDTEGAVARFLYWWDHPEILDIEFNAWPQYTTYGGLRTKGVDIIRAYADRLKWNERTVIAAEHKFLVPFGRHELTGVVDLLEMQRNHKGKDVLKVIDFKTASRKPNRSELMVNIQFSVYVYASMQKEFWVGVNEEPFVGLPKGEFYYEAFKEVPRRAIWHHLWTGTEMDAGDRGELEFRRLYRLCEEMERSMAAEIFLPDISGETCGWCPFQEPCGVDIPSPEEVVSQDSAWL